MCVFACQTAIDSPRRASRSLDRQFAVACLPVLAHHPQTFVDPPRCFSRLSMSGRLPRAGACPAAPPPTPSCWLRERERARERFPMSARATDAPVDGDRDGGVPSCWWRLGAGVPLVPPPPAGLPVREPDDTCALRNRRSVCILLPAHRGLETYTYMMRPRPPCVGAGALSRLVHSCPPRAGSSTRGS